jgi:hypothetical protein
VTVPSATDLERLRVRLARLTRTEAPPFVAADAWGLITHVDRPLADALGWPVDDLVGQPLTAIIPRRFRDAHHVGFARFLSTGVPTLLDRPLAFWVATRGGQEWRAEHVITAIEGERGWLFGAVIRTEGVRHAA